MTTSGSVLGVFHFFCKPARNSRRQSEEKVNCLHSDSYATRWNDSTLKYEYLIHIFGKILKFGIPVCPVN